LNAARFVAETDDVFGRIAQRYDLLCDVFSLCIHRLWKARLASLIASSPAKLILDVASGTGDIPQRVRRQADGLPGRRIVVSDLSAAMLTVARRKLGESASVEYAILDAHRLDSIASGSVDLYSIAFGLKICDRRKVLAEAFRVLRPGGVFLSLEAARIPLDWLHSLYLGYMDWCLPVIARIATGGDRSAYDYLLRGIHDFPAPSELAREIASHGFTAVSYQRLTFGIVALHRAVKP